MNLEHKDKQTLEHIIKYCNEIQLAVQCFGKDEETFKSNPVFLNACSMPLLQIGELAKKLTPDFIKATSNIPWQEIKGMRDFFAHDYRSMNKHVIWITVIKHVPNLQEQCNQLLRPPLPYLNLSIKFIISFIDISSSSKTEALFAARLS